MKGNSLVEKTRKNTREMRLQFSQRECSEGQPRAVITGVWQARQQVWPEKQEAPKGEMGNIKNELCYLDSLSLGLSLPSALK